MKNNIQESIKRFVHTTNITILNVYFFYSYIQNCQRKHKTNCQKKKIITKAKSYNKLKKKKKNENTKHNKSNQTNNSIFVFAFFIQFI